MIDFLLNVVLDGLLLGGFYTIISIGLTISFGLLNISNVAHPTFMIMAGYVAYLLNAALGIDPLILTVITFPLFFFVGCVLYSIYNRVIAKRGYEGLMDLVFWFSFLIITEVVILMTLGSDYKSFYSAYMASSIRFLIFTIPFRLLIPFIFAVIIDVILYNIFSRTYFGLGVRALPQNRSSAMLMGYNPNRLELLAFGLSTATAAIGGCLLLMIQPIYPFLDRQFIGRIFAVTVLGGMGSFYGTIIAALIIGVIEAIVSAFFGASWSLCISFAVLLLTLVVSPRGLLRR